jgi:hypothetical protein
MDTHGYKNENPMTPDEILVRQNSLADLSHKKRKEGESRSGNKKNALTLIRLKQASWFVAFYIISEKISRAVINVKKYFVILKNVGIMLSHIKLGTFRLFLKRIIKINYKFLLLKHLNLNSNPAKKISSRNETKWVRPILSHFFLAVYFVLLFFFVFAARFGVDAAPADGETITYESALVWRTDGAGDYTLPVISEKASYAGTPAIATKGVIKSITASWAFEGDVQLSVSADDGLHYTPVVNGVPLVSGFPAGTSLKWNAAVGPASKLTEVKITYTDSSGVVGSFGAPELSGFKYRKAFYLSGSSVPNLFNYQTKITLGESNSAKGADISCDNHILADFNDVRFVAADGQTPLPFSLEKISGVQPNRIATFFVKAPQIPASGLALYVYYGNPSAANLSNPQNTFDFYEDFTAGAAALDQAKWVTHLSPGGSSSLSKNGLLLDAASLMTKDFQFKGGVIEYAATPKTGFEVRLIIRESSPDIESDAGEVAYSSAYQDAEHCIAVGKIVKANVANPSVKETFYDYRVSVDGENNITFDRYSDGFSEKQASVTYQDAGGLTSGFMGLKTAGSGLGASQTLFSWIRVRKYALIEPLVNASTVGKEEPVAPPIFVNTTLAPNGDLTLADAKSDGTYLTRPSTSAYDIRIIVPRWKGSGAQVDISADGGKTYKKNCTNEAYYYAARGDFTKGSSLCSRLVLKAGAGSSVSSLEFVALQYALGSIVVLAPNGGETLKQGTSTEIKWTAWDYESGYPMKLEYSLDNGKTFKTITNNAGNNGTYLWQIPLTPDLSTTNALVRVSDSYDAVIGAVSQKPFTILAGEGAPPAETAVAVMAQPPQAPPELPAPIVSPVKEKKEAKVEEAGELKDYEVVLKVGDNHASNPREDIRSALKDGDIVAVVPAGHSWSDTERNTFLIVPVKLTESQAADLVGPKEVATGKKDENGNPVREAVYASKNKINIAKLGFDKKIKRDIAAMNAVLKTQTLSAADVIEGK